VTLVLDGNESTPAIDAVMLQVANEAAVAPALWRVEVANGLQTALRRKRIDEAYRDATFSRSRGHAVKGSVAREQPTLRQ